MSDNIKIISDLIKEDFALTARIGAEIEFYFSSGDGAYETDHKCLTAIVKQAKEDGIVIAGLNFENGERQYEFALAAVNDAQLIAKHLVTLKEIIVQQAENEKITVDFSAKPYENQPGSALHIHISMEDESHKNIFIKQSDNEDIECDTLLHSVGGMLKLMPQSMVFFAPDEKSYTRFTSRHNEDIPDDKPLRRYNNAPINISWGNNNRSTALRIPSQSNRQNEYHIEHRVACANANPYDVISAILAGIHYGLYHKIAPPAKIYGNAFDKQYNCPALPATFCEAEEIAKNDTILATYSKSTL